MAGKSSSETKKPYPLTPYNPAEHIEAWGGAARLKRILRAQEKVEPDHIPSAALFEKKPSAKQNKS